MEANSADGGFAKGTAYPTSIQLSAAYPTSIQLSAAFLAKCKGVSNQIVEKANEKKVDLGGMDHA